MARASSEATTSSVAARSDRPSARAHALGAVISTHAEQIERTQRFPDAVLRPLHQSRLLRMLLPRSVGGDEVQASEYLHAIEALALYDGSIAWNAFVANSAALIAPHLPLDTAKTIFSDPETVVSWGPPNECRAFAVAGGYRITGHWPFASGCRQANWMGAHCHVVEPDGSLRLNGSATPLIRTLLFPAEQATLYDDWQPSGLRGTSSNSYSVEDVFVSEAFSGTREDPEGRRDPGPLYAFTQQGLYAVGVAGVAIGLAQGMMNEFAKLAQTKTPRGLERLADSVMVQDSFAHSTAQLSAARAWLCHVLDEVSAKAPREGAIDVESRAQVRLACSHAIENAVEIGNSVHHSAGVSALFPDSPFERRFRDLHTVSQQIQSRRSHFANIGSILLGHRPNVFY
ncbi:MAG: hypothetical protein K0U93_14790 [Gammaproteobacteria bacterium]|nr:hypothetical protein [Gammaproteobacteria bacterium]